MAELSVAVHHRDGVVVLVASGDVRGNSDALRDLVGVALHALDDQPAVIAVCDLYVHQAEGLAALRWLLRQRPAGAPTVVIARSAQRRRLPGVFGAQVAWYPAELHTAWIGVAASLSHRRRHLTGDQRTDPGEEQISRLLWAAAQERAALTTAARDDGSGRLDDVLPLEQAVGLRPGARVDDHAADGDDEQRHGSGGVPRVVAGPPGSDARSGQRDRSARQ